MTTEQNKYELIGEYKCPKCGGSQRVFDSVHTKLELQGKHQHGDVYFYNREVRQLLPMTSAVLTMPIVSLYTDVCVSCGTAYVFRIDYQEAPIRYLSKLQQGKN